MAFLLSFKVVFYVFFVAVQVIFQRHLPTRSEVQIILSEQIEPFLIQRHGLIGQNRPHVIDSNMVCDLTGLPLLAILPHFVPVDTLRNGRGINPAVVKQGRMVEQLDAIEIFHPRIQ